MNKLPVGEKIKSIRLEKKITQKDLAASCGLSVNSIQNIEYGKFTPRTGTIEKIAAALDVSPFDLMGYEYFDAITDTEALAAQVKQIDSFEKYLNSLGFIIDENRKSTDEVEYKLTRDGQQTVFTAK